ncbi:MAG: polysaccharide biosynthesis protein [uncultured bacterium (gcode 4)]|uniref:Polysaccharide biosynthesis protein n=1 Tax=uncultured bacterium (gcode 4) TaxID=1234023 RepID=K2BUV6_9BACT|nr:MAG: polysaccharide biosynthesis protein [uncultured bacterium (gcode 4)]
MATKKVYFNTIAQLAGKFSTAFISIFLIKILTNYLSLDDYGLYSKIYNYLSIFAVIADMGLFTITIREISANRENKDIVRKIIWNMMTIRLSLGFLIIFLAVGIAFFLPWYNSSLALWSIFITSFFVFFWLMNSAILSLLQAYLKTEFSFISTTVWKIANFLLILFVVFILYPKWAIMWNSHLQFSAFLWIMFAGVFGNIVMTLLIYFYSRKVEKINFSFHLPQIKSLVKMSIPYGLAMFLNVIYFKIDVIILSIMEPRNIADTSIALYSVPMKIVEVWMLFGWLFLQSMLPLFTNAIKKKDNIEMKMLVSKSYKLLLAFWIAIIGFSLVNWREILSLIASREYLDHSKYLYNSLDSYNVVIFIFLFYFISSIFTYILIASWEQGRLLKINFYLTILNIVLNIILIPRFSFVGSSVATLISQVFLVASTYFVSRHIFRFNFMPGYTFKILFLWVLASLVNFLIISHFSLWVFLSLIISFVIFWAIYFPGFYLSYKKI